MHSISLISIEPSKTTAKILSTTVVFRIQWYTMAYAVQHTQSSDGYLATQPITPTTSIAQAGAIWLARLETAGLDIIDDDLDLTAEELAEREQERHHSKQTINSYHIAFTLFQRWLERHDRTTVGMLVLDDLANYARSLRKRDYDLSMRAQYNQAVGNPQKRLTARTIHGYTRPLLGFLALLESFEAVSFRIEAVRAELTRILPRPPDPVAPTPPDLRRLVCFYDQPPTQDERTARLRLIRLRNAALLHLLFSSGARISELLSLNVGDIYRDRRVQSRVMVYSKGRHQGIIFVRRRAERAMSTYLKERGHPATTAPLFESLDRRTAGARLTRSSAWRIVHAAAETVATHIELEGKYDEAAILRQTSPHTFRHFVGYHLLNEGLELAEVSQILRHRSVEVTRNYYARYSDVQLQEVHDQFSADPEE